MGCDAPYGRVIDPWTSPKVNSAITSGTVAWKPTTSALRAGGTESVLGCVVKAPSTLGTFLRSFRRVNPTPGPKLARLATYSYHPCISDRAGDTLDLEADHRRHAEIEDAIRDPASSAGQVLKYGVGLNHLPSGRFPDQMATGTFRTDLVLTDPEVSGVMVDAVRDLELSDFEVSNGVATAIQVSSGGVYVITVEPTTLGQPVTVSLPANRVTGVG